ncbi:unnamed protein product [marine sediment metagenome]|uniref:Uncharacterized protein n=1 Tax=marine sediment metagenome TaxID=412755 RepID=X1D6G1_9ZZZZ
MDFSAPIAECKRIFKEHGNVICDDWDSVCKPGFTRSTLSTQWNLTINQLKIMSDVPINNKGVARGLKKEQDTSVFECVECGKDHRSTYRMLYGKKSQDMRRCANCKNIEEYSVAGSHFSDAPAGHGY